MAGGFATGSAAVVAALAVGQNPGVIEAGRGPGERAMAVTAFLPRNQVASRHR
jgi:hypothetical protein